MSTEDETHLRRLDELNLAIDVATQELRKLVLERDAILEELTETPSSSMSVGDPTDQPTPVEPVDRFVVPWSPEEDRL